MANIRDIKNRIVSVKNTKQITNAMKMVAASKLRKAQEKIISAREYADYLDLMIRTVKFKNPSSENPFITNMADTKKKKVLVVITADRGLCGSFNSNIIRAAKKFINANPETDVICIGKKGYDTIRKSSDKVVEKFLNLFNSMDFSHSKAISRFIIKLYLEDNYNKIDVIYNEFKSAIQQNVIERQLLPIVPLESDVVSTVDYLYEPDEETLINELGEKHVDVEIWRMLLESSAAEQGARMTAMDNATENANDLIAQLTLLHNRARQSSITTEIIEIASGAEAINK